LTSSVVLCGGDTLSITKAIVACTQSMLVSDFGVLMLIDPTKEREPDTSSQVRPARLSWRLSSEAQTLNERLD
jgi:hypothetical protein